MTIEKIDKKIAKLYNNYTHTGWLDFVELNYWLGYKKFLENK